MDGHQVLAGDGHLSGDMWRRVRHGMVVVCGVLFDGDLSGIEEAIGDVCQGYGRRLLLMASQCCGVNCDRSPAYHWFGL
jgi:hypothetical protein